MIFSLQWRHNGAIVYQIIGVSIVYSTTDQRKDQSPGSLAFVIFVMGIHRWPVTSEFPSQRANDAEMFTFDDVIMLHDLWLLVAVLPANQKPGY